LRNGYPVAEILDSFPDSTVSEFIREGIMRILNIKRSAVIGLVAASVLAFAAPASAQTREVIVGTPGFTNVGGLEIITKAFEAETGIKVTVKSGGMDDVKKLATDGSADAVFLPADEMDQVKDAIKAGTRKRIGRSYQGLAVMKGTKVPDISTKEKFIAAMKSANLVLHSRCNGPPGGAGSPVSRKDGCCGVMPVSRMPTVTPLPARARPPSCG